MSLRLHPTACGGAVCSAVGRCQVRLHASVASRLFAATTDVEDQPELGMLATASFWLM